MNTISTFLLIFAASVLLQAQFRAKARIIGLVDVPMGRKRHGGMPAVTGGVALFIVLTAALLTVAPYKATIFLPMLALGMLVLCGMLDDMFHVPAKQKLLVEIVAAIVMLAAGDALLAGIDHLPVVGSVTLGPLALPISVLLVVGFINAFNMIDGMDGLAGGTALIALVWLAVATLVSGDSRHLLIVIGAALPVLAGFLAFNIRHPWHGRASIFLGDAGSMLLGGLLAWLALSLANAPVVPVPLVTILWIVGVPLTDCLVVIIRRALRGHNPMKADRTHLHHYLSGAGLSVEQTVVALLAANVATGATGIIGWVMGVPEEAMLAGLLLLPALELAVTGWLRRRRVIVALREPSLP